MAADRPLCGALSGLQSGVSATSTYVSGYSGYSVYVCECVCVSHCVFGVCLASLCLRVRLVVSPHWNLIQL